VPLVGTKKFRAWHEQGDVTFDEALEGPWSFDRGGEDSRYHDDRCSSTRCRHSDRRSQACLKASRSTTRLNFDAR
jgi:hypothetical protein